MESWERCSDELQYVDLEVDRLAMLCGLSLLQPGVIDAILRDDRHLCLVDNHNAWQALRRLLIQRHTRAAGCTAPQTVAMAADLRRLDTHELRERTQPRGL